MANAHIQQPPCLNDVAADGGIHEAGKERHAEHFSVGEIRIGPRLDGTGSLEHLQCKADDMEQQDCLGLVQRFQPAPDHEELNGERNDQQHVITGNTEQSAMRRHEDGDEEQACKQAGAGFLDTEIQKLDDKTPEAFEFAPGIGIAKQIIQDGEAACGWTCPYAHVHAPICIRHLSYENRKELAWACHPYPRLILPASGFWQLQWR
ncbi:hypothetical protein D3C80_1260090 [compost metagenome]